MIFGRTRQERMVWRRWFAWRPIHLPDGRWVWWQYVERHPYVSHLALPGPLDPSWHYRLPKQETVDG